MDKHVRTFVLDVHVHLRKHYRSFHLSPAPSSDRSMSTSDPVHAKTSSSVLSFIGLSFKHFPSSQRTLSASLANPPPRREQPQDSGIFSVSHLSTTQPESVKIPSQYLGWSYNPPFVTALRQAPRSR